MAESGWNGWTWFEMSGSRPCSRDGSWIKWMNDGIMGWCDPVMMEWWNDGMMAWIGAYYNEPKFKCRPVSGTGWFSYKIWTQNSKTPKVNCLNNLKPLQNHILKIQWEIHFWTIPNTDQNAHNFFWNFIRKLLSKLWEAPELENLPFHFQHFWRSIISF